MICEWGQIDSEGRPACSRCGRAYWRPARDGEKINRQCNAVEKDLTPRRNRPRKAGPRVRGVGDALHSLIVKWTGQGIRAGCGCESVMAKMNAWGPDGCREHMPEIVAKIRTEAKRRGLWSVLARVPGASQPIRWMVNAAIAEIERGTTGGGADDQRAAEGD